MKKGMKKGKGEKRILSLTVSYSQKSERSN